MPSTLQESWVPGMLSAVTRALSGMSRIHELCEMNSSTFPPVLCLRAPLATLPAIDRTTDDWLIAYRAPRRAFAAPWPSGSQRQPQVTYRQAGFAGLRVAEHEGGARRSLSATSPLSTSPRIEAGRRPSGLQTVAPPSEEPVPLR